MVILLVTCGCRPPCAKGYTRGQDLVCYPDSLVAKDSGNLEPTDSGLGDTPDRSEHPDTGLDTGLDDSTPPAEGWGRIRVMYPSFDGYPSHAFLTYGRRASSVLPQAAFCTFIFADTFEIDGYLVSWDGTTNPCPSEGDPVYLPPGAFVIHLMVTSSISADPVICDTRTVEIDGDVTVDYTGVDSCLEE